MRLPKSGSTLLVALASLAMTTETATEMTARLCAQPEYSAVCGGFTPSTEPAPSPPPANEPNKDWLNNALRELCEGEFYRVFNEKTGECEYVSPNY